MSGPVRNFCIARGVLAATGLKGVYTVPAATSLILKSVYVYLSTGGSANCSAYAYSRAGDALLVFAHLSVSGYLPSSWQSELVLNDGDVVALSPDVVGVTYWVSGALLPYASGQVAPA